MKSILESVAIVVVATLLLAVAPVFASTSGVVISQVYGGGGNSGAPLQNDYIEVFNAGTSTVDIGGWSVQYASYHGKSWSNLTLIPAGTTLQAGQYFLIQEAAGNGAGSAPPTPDLTGTIRMSATHGKVALVNSSAQLAGYCPSGSSVVDFIGYGSSGTNGCSEGNDPAPSLDNTKAALRNDAGCADTDDNGQDFSANAPGPRNSSTAVHICVGGGATITLSIADVSHAEGDSGTTPFDFKVNLSAPAPAGGVTFNIATGGGTAVAGQDYIAKTVTGATIAQGDSAYDFVVEVNGSTAPGPNKTFFVTASDIQGTSVVTTSAKAKGTIYNDHAANVAIYGIEGSPSTQGPEGASPYVGRTVSTSGTVTAVQPGNGFYMQTPDSRSDNDPLTSDGIFVFDGSANVQVGDDVTLSAKVEDYFGMTELGDVEDLTVASSGNPLPTAVQFNANTPSSDPHALSCGTTNYRCFLGMRVSIANGFVTEGSGYSKSHTYDYLYVTANGKRSLRGPGLLYGLKPTPGKNPDALVWSGNPQVFELEPNEFPGVNNDQVPINGGSTFTATGVIGYDFGAFAFYPTQLDVTYRAPMPRPVPGAKPSILRIGSFNVERFCDNVDETEPNGSEVFACSGGSVPTTAEFDEKAQRVADYIGSVLKLPDVVALEEVENMNALTELVQKIHDTYGVTYTPRLIEGNDPSGIDVALLVNPRRVLIFGVQQFDKSLKWVTPNHHVRAVFDHPPLVLQGLFIGGGAPRPFAVMVNHIKARSNVDDVYADGTPTKDALEDQEKRLRQAYGVALLAEELNTAAPAKPLVIVGDFNSYQFTDGYVDVVGMITGHYNFSANYWDLSDLTKWNLQPQSPPLRNVNVVNPPFWDAVNSIPANERYSYLYTVDLGPIQGYGIGGGSREVPTDQVLDHALLNPAARAVFVRMDYGRADEDAASETEYESKGAIGVSDHDGFVVQLNFQQQSNQDTRQSTRH